MRRLADHIAIFTDLFLTLWLCLAIVCLPFIAIYSYSYGGRGWVLFLGVVLILSLYPQVKREFSRNMVKTESRSTAIRHYLPGILFGVGVGLTCILFRSLSDAEMFWQPHLLGFPYEQITDPKMRTLLHEGERLSFWKTMAIDGLNYVIRPAVFMILIQFGWNELKALSRNPPRPQPVERTPILQEYTI